MAWTLCAEADAIALAGANANATIIAAAATLQVWDYQAEAEIVARTDYDWVTNYASLGTQAKYLLNALCASMVAVRIIKYDMSYYYSRIEAQTMIIVLQEDIKNMIGTLKDVNVRTKLGVSA
jgi:hypothetical protein